MNTTHPVIHLGLVIIPKINPIPKNIANIITTTIKNSQIVVPATVKKAIINFLSITIKHNNSNKKSNINKFSTPFYGSREYIFKHYKQGKSFSERSCTVTLYTVPLGTLNKNEEARFKALTMSLPSPSVV